MNRGRYTELRLIPHLDTDGVTILAGAGPALPIGKYAALWRTTVQVVAAALSADLRIEVSDDNVTWVEVAAFTAAGIAGPFGVHEFMRVRAATYTSSTGLAIKVAGFDLRAV